MIDLSGMFWTVWTTGFRTNSIFTGKCKKEKDVKEKRFWDFVWGFFLKTVS